MKTVGRLLGTSLIAGFVLVLTGCGAATQGSIRTLVPPNKEVNLGGYSKLLLEVKSNDGVSITSPDRERIAGAIISKIKEKAPSRFGEINPQTSDPATLRAIVTLTQYEEGNAFARFMLAGLGQIHIDAEVVLENYASKAQLSKHEVTKTFAWGGFYGASTTIRDVEAGFVEAVVAVLLGPDQTLSPAPTTGFGDTSG